MGPDQWSRTEASKRVGKLGAPPHDQGRDTLILVKGGDEGPLRPSVTGC